MSDQLAGRELVDSIVEHAQSKKAAGITVLDVRGTSTVSDWLVICQGENPIHNRAIYDTVAVELKKQKTSPYLYEGHEEGRWIVIDYVDVVVHVLMPHLRKYYALEDLWKSWVITIPSLRIIALHLMKTALYIGCLKVHRHLIVYALF